MQIEIVFPYRVEYSDLTPVQYEAAKQYCVDNEIPYEDYSGDDRTDMLRTVQATDEQTAALQAVLS